MNFDIKALTQKIHNALAFLRRHAAISCIIIFGVLYGYILFTVSAQTQKSPDETAVTDQLNAVPRPKIDKSAAKTMESLEDRNVNVQAIFDQARDNPFTE
jgi:hypothetical protein